MATMGSTLGFDLYHQTLANVRFFSLEHAYVRIITAREPSGDHFRVAVVREVDMGRHREVVLSETAVSVHMALRALHLRSAEAVHNHIAMYGFDFPPEAKIHREDDVWGSDDEVASGFSVDESTVAFSGIISNDGFSDNDDVAVEFEDDDRNDVDAIDNIENLVSELSIAGDENQAPKAPFPELKVTPASPPTPTANSSKRKARKIRAPMSRSRYTRSRSRSKSSASRQPLQPRDSVPEPPVRPPVGGVRPYGPQVPPQTRHLPPQAHAPPAAPTAKPNGNTIPARDVPRYVQSWEGYDNQAPMHIMNNPPNYTAMPRLPRAGGPGMLPPPPPPPVGSPFILPGRQHPPFVPPFANFIDGYTDYTLRDRTRETAPLPPPGPLPVTQHPTPPPQPKANAPRPTLYDVRLRITCPGRVTARIVERCAPSRRAVIDAALAYVRAHPAVFGGLPAHRGPGPWDAVPIGGANNPNRLMKGTLKQAWFRQMRNGVVCDESYDMTTYVEDDLTKLFDPTNGAMIFEVEVLGGGCGQGPFRPSSLAGATMMAGGVPQSAASCPPVPRGGGMVIPLGTYHDLTSEDEEIIDD